MNKIIKPIILLFAIIYVVVFVNIIVNIQPYSQGGSIWSLPSVRELLINDVLICFLIFYISLFLKMRNSVTIFLFISIQFILGLIYFVKILRCFYPFVVDLVGIVVTIVLILQIKAQVKCSYLFIAIFPLLYLIVFISIIKIKFPTDLRSNNVIYLKTIYESDTLNDYIYELHNINDTESRLKKIIKVFDGNIQNGRYYFLEDTTAALTFCRNYIDNIWNDYSYDMKDYYSVLFINYADNMYLENFNCRCDSSSFKIVSSDNNSIDVVGDFDDLTLKRFCAFQKFLTQEILDLTNYKIVLYNNENEFKIGIQYFENDRYKLYLDKSFLDDD